MSSPSRLVHISRFWGRSEETDLLLSQLDGDQQELVDHLADDLSSMKDVILATKAYLKTQPSIRDPMVKASYLTFALHLYMLLRGNRQVEIPDYVVLNTSVYHLDILILEQVAALQGYAL